MKKILCAVFLIIIFSVLLFLHNEKTLAISKKEAVDDINLKISTVYEKFGNNLSNIHSNLVLMQDFFQSEPDSIPNIYDKYYFVLDTISSDMKELEKDALKLNKLCDNLENYSNKVCFVYNNSILEVKENNQVLIKKFNDVILKYNDMSLSNYEIFR